MQFSFGYAFSYAVFIWVHISYAVFILVHHFYSAMHFHLGIIILTSLGYAIFICVCTQNIVCTFHFDGISLFRCTLYIVCGCVLSHLNARSIIFFIMELQSEAIDYH